MSMNSNDRSINDVVKKATEYYEHSVIPRAAVAAIPYIGGTLDILLSGYAARRWQKKVASMFEELGSNLAKITENQVNKEFINSEEFESLIIRVIQALQTTHEREKISYFANILSKVVTTELLQNEKAQRYIGLVDELTGLHIRILKTFADRPREVMDASTIADMIGGDFQEIQAYCSDLEAHSLLYNPTIGTYGGGGGRYRIHPSAIPFLEFLNVNKP